MPEARKVGDILDGLGVTALIEDSDMIVNAVVLMKAVGPDGSPGFIMTRDETATWMDEFMLVKLAEREVSKSELSPRDED